MEHVQSLGGYSITRLLSFIFINLKNTDGRYRSIRSTSPVETRKNETLKKKKIESRRAISKYTNLIGFCYNIKKDLKQIRSRCPCTKNQIFHQISSSFNTVLIGNQPISYLLTLLLSLQYTLNLFRHYLLITYNKEVATFNQNNNYHLYKYPSTRITYKL